MKAISIAFSTLCLFGLCLSTVNASASPTRKYEFLYDNGTGTVMAWNLTAPVYASRGSPQTFIWEFAMLAGASNIAMMRFEVTADLDTGGKQQIYYSILLQGTYSAGYKTTVTPIVTVPSNAALGSVLNVSIYTSLNKYFLFPTEIRDTNYDDLQSAYNNAVSQINELNQQVDSLNQMVNSLNQQVTDLTNEKNTLSSEVNTLNQQVNDLSAQVQNLTQQLGSMPTEIATLTAEKEALNQQVSSLNSRVAGLDSQLANENYGIVAAIIIAVVAVAAAAYMAVRRKRPAQITSQNA